MIRALFIAALLSLPTNALAREIYGANVLNEADTAALKGKRFAVTRHPPAGLKLRTLSASFGLVGALIGAKDSGAMAKAGIDPTDIIERELTPVFVSQFGLQLRGGASPIIKAKKVPDIVASQADVDYVLDILPTTLSTIHRKASTRYWVGYGVRVLLIQRDTARVVYKAQCKSDTLEHPSAPKLKSLSSNNAQLFKDVVSKLAWSCLHRMTYYLYLPEGTVPATPVELADPMAAYAAAHPED